MKHLAINAFCKTGSGGTPSRSKKKEYYDHGTIPWIKSGELAQEKIEFAEESITEKAIAESSAKLLSPGAILLAMYGATVGQVSRLNISAATNQAICHIYPDTTVCDPDYLYRVLKGAKNRLLAKRVGAGQPNIRQTIIRNFSIPLPPLPKQKRIAAILDVADALRAKRRESLQQLDQLLQSTFLEMFGDPVTNPKGWEKCTVGDVVHSAKDGPHVSPKYSEEGIPFLSNRHIKPGEIVWEDLKFIDQDEADRQWKKCKPEFGDILYTKGGTTGLAARVTTSKAFAVWVHVALLKPISEKVDTAWLEGMLNSAYCYAQSQRYTHGIANRDLGLKRMVKIKMYLPPLNLQQHFATIVESIEQQKARCRAQLDELDTLFASLQSRAFNGEL